MSVKYEDLQGLHEDTTPNEGLRVNSFIPQGILMNKWIPSPLSRLNCSPLTLLLGLLITILFFTVIITQVRVTREVTEVKTSVNRILSDEVAGALTNGLQKLLAAIMPHVLAAENRTSETWEESGPCGEGWNHKNGSCYFYGWNLKTWKYAKKSCEDRQSHLVVITSKEEMTLIREITYMATVWIGLVSEGGAWKWVDGTSYEKNPKFWLKGQPDNWFGHGLEGGEDCAQVVDGDGWNDIHCTLTFPYICEKEI